MELEVDETLSHGRHFLICNYTTYCSRLPVPRLQVGTRHGGVDAGGHGYYAAGGGHGAAGNGLEAARLEGKAKVHRFDGVADWAGAGEVEHVAAGDQVHGVAVLEAKREEVVGVLLLARHLG